MGTAVSPAALRQKLSDVKDTVYFKGGTILVTQLSEVFQVTKNLTFIGGFDPAATGKVKALPHYPSKTPTIFSGDANANGKPDSGDASALIRVDYSKDSTCVFRLIGCNLVNTYYSNPGESTKDIDTYLNNCSAIRVICGTTFIKNCEMYNHIAPVNRGSQCVTAVGAKVHLIDCDLHDCQCLSRGALVRSRQFFINGDKTKPIAPSIVIERCALHDANNMGGAKDNSSGIYGCAVHMAAGELLAINSTFMCDTTYNKGGAIYSTTGITVISCTIAQNYGARAYSTTDPKPYAYGTGIGLNNNCKFNLMNNFIVDDKDDNTKKNAPFYTDTNTLGMEDFAKSGGYNILGSIYVICNGKLVTDQSKVWKQTDLTSSSTKINKFSDFFNSVADLKNNGGFSKSILPKSMQSGPSVADLQAFADNYCPKWTKVDASVDQRGYERDAKVTCVGAAAYEGSAPTSIYNVSEKSDAKSSNIRKVIINNNLYIIHNDKTYNAQGILVE